MLSHITIGISNLDRAFAFYTRILAPPNYVLKFHEPTQNWAGWKLPDAERPLFIITVPIDGDAPSAGNGTMTAFLAKDRVTVDAVHAAALLAGGQDEGAPGLRPQISQELLRRIFPGLGWE